MLLIDKEIKDIRKGLGSDPCKRKQWLGKNSPAVFK